MRDSETTGVSMMKTNPIRLFPTLRLVGLSILLGSSAVVMTPIAHAQTTDESRAIEMYENGAALYGEGDYAGAIQAFREAYKLAPTKHSMLVNIANAQERLGELEAAAESLKTYRVYAPAEERDALGRRVFNLEKRVEEKAQAARLAEIEEQRKAAEQAAAQTAALRSETTAPPRKITPRKAAAYSLLGGGAGVLAAGGVMAGVSHGQSRTAIENNDQDAFNATKPMNRAGIGLAVGGGVAVATGLVLALLPDKSRAPAVGVAPTADGVDVMFSWRLGRRGN